MNTRTLTTLIQKLSSLGLETFELFNNRGNRQGFGDLIAELCRTLLQLKGEASSVAIAEAIIRNYQAATDAEKTTFFQYLYLDLGADADKVSSAIGSYQANPSQEALLMLTEACEPPRRELLRTLNTAPQGTMALIAMREDLQRLLGRDPIFAVLDNDFIRLFRAWFNRGFLVLHRIDWQTPALVLEKLIEYESVHEIQGWPDLRRRLERDRRCYGFFHPVIPDVPLIFVEAALTDHISTDVSALLQQDPPALDAPLPSTAMFYSINNCLPGLRGISFGNFLIKQVIEHLAVEAPHITRYVTLSPVPGFMKWLASKPEEMGALEPTTQLAVDTLLTGQMTAETVAASLPLQNVLPVLCARYLVLAKSRSKPLDPVARFHLGNGARLERINWMADASDNGMAQAAGLMVNYIYDRKTVARNHEAYEQQHEVVYSAAVKKLLAQ